MPPPGRDELDSTMIGVEPHHPHAAGYDAEGDLPLKTAVIDPSAKVDLQTGALIGKKSAEERKFVARLDALLLVYTCVSQVLKYLDQQNISNAYVSGMKEDLNLNGNQYNYFTTYFNIGYAIFLVPSQIIITRVRPSWWLPGLEFMWGVLTLGLFLVTSAEQIYAIRAFIGVFEASCYPGALMLLMSWYTPREIALRIGFYHSCQSVGLMLSGALQTAIFTSMHGALGHAGWRWMFLVDGLMTICWSLLGLVFIPDFPNSPNPWARSWLSPKHIEMAKERTARFRRSENKKFTLATIKRTFKEPLFYFFITLYPAAVLAQQGYSYFTLFLKSLTNPDGTQVWSTAAVNAIPIGGAALIMVTVWVYAAISDYFQTRWLVVMGQAFLGLVPAIMLTVWDISLNAKYFAYFASYLSVATAPPLFAWMSDMSPHDAEQRAFILGFSIAFYYAVGAWSNVLIWPASQVPHYKYAWQACIALWLFVILELGVLRYVELKYIRPKNRRIAEEKARLQLEQEREEYVGDAEEVYLEAGKKGDLGGVDAVQYRV